MPVALPTLADLDRRLRNARSAYYEALRLGRLRLADLAYATIDELLEQRHAQTRRLGG